MVLDFLMEYKISFLSKKYGNKKFINFDIKWISGERDNAIIIIREDSINLENLYLVFSKYERIIKEFILALQVDGNCRVSFTREYAKVIINGKTYDIYTKETVEGFIKYINNEAQSFGIGGLPQRIDARLADIEIEIVNLPDAVLCVPLKFERLAATIILANIANGWDLILKVSFLILEEFRDLVDPVVYKEIKLTRDFISHPVCRNTELVNYIVENGLQIYSGEGVSFQRTDTNHIKFVSDKASLCRKIAIKIVKDEIIKGGGQL